MGIYTLTVTVEVTDTEALITHGHFHREAFKLPPMPNLDVEAALRLIFSASPLSVDGARIVDSQWRKEN